ncbi:MAG: DNA cytosine methyltransferase [Bacteroidetes bacterium]|nr:DNA cytosine methyltransferase [Bacteroidota bacterium]
MNNTIPILSTFSGGGFLDMGFMKEEFQISAACEIEPSFTTAYNSGIKSFLSKAHKSKSISMDVQHFDIEKPIDISSSKEQLLISKKYKNSIEGIIGGPPCQDYSTGGKNAGVEGLRGKLIYSYLELINLVQPSFIFFENVSGLYNTKTHQLAFFDLVKKLEKNYTLWYEVLNSLDYGVPQDRARVVLVGFKKNIVRKLIQSGYKLIDENKLQDNLVFRWPNKKFKNPKNILWPKTWSFGSDIHEEELNNIPKIYSPLFVASAFSKINNDDINQQEFFNPYSKRFNEINEGDTNRKSFKRLHRYRFSPTVAYGNNEVHLHPTEARRLSVREALRLQTVPDSYILPKEITLTQKFKIISNGVPTQKAALIAKEIRRTMQNYYSTF